MDRWVLLRDGLLWAGGGGVRDILVDLEGKLFFGFVLCLTTSVWGLLEVLKIVKRKYVRIQFVRVVYSNPPYDFLSDVRLRRAAYEYVL